MLAYFRLNQMREPCLYSAKEIGKILHHAGWPLIHAPVHFTASQGWQSHLNNVVDHDDS